MTIRQLLNLATDKLKNKSTSPELDAEVLLAHVLKQSKEYLFQNQESTRLPARQGIKNQEQKKFQQLVKKRATGWPVAYLTHEKEFFGLNFYVDQNVLIPRPETEGLVEMATKKIIDYKLKIINDKPLSVLDLGTGSGCIIIALANNLQSKIYNLKFFASDISQAALKIAKQNAKRHEVSILFKQSDLLAAWKNQRFDIIVANLPYLARQTDPSTKFEPKQALIAKKQGLALIEKLFKQLAVPFPLPPSPSTLLLEIGHDQGPKIKNLAKVYLPGYQCKIFKDLSGLNRLVLLTQPAWETSKVRKYASVYPTHSGHEL